MPGGKDFQTLFDDHTIWINYDATNNGQLWGWTMPNAHPRDIVVAQFALRMGRWSTAATTVHELAHLNGAPGGASHAAEHTVKACRMSSPAGPYDPGVIGQFVQRLDTAIA